METGYTNIEEIHDSAFEFLSNRHFEEKRKGNTLLFRLRQRFSSLKQSFWFLGNADYAAISFWTGSDYKNKTPNIYFEIRPDGLIRLFLIGVDNEKKVELFKELAQNIEGISMSDFAIWSKVYTENHDGVYLKYLENFISGDKKIIDNYLQAHLIDFNSTQFEDINIESLNDEEFSEPFTRPYTEDEFYDMYAGVIRRRNQTEDFFFSPNKTYDSVMPLCIKSFEVRNFKGIDHLKVESIPVDSKWIVLTGENGYGKSSVLQSLAIGLFGVSDGPYQLLTESSYVMLEAKRNNENFVNQSIDAKSKIRRFNSVGKQLAVYGATRLNMAKDNHRPDIGNVTYNLFFTDGSLINIEAELVESNAYNKHQFNLLKSAFQKLIPDLSDIKVESKGINQRPIVIYTEKDKDGNPYQEIQFDQLASGFRNIIAVVGDIVSRFSVYQTENIEDLSHLQGIVIIDEFELHLHPRYQKLLPKILSEIFPNIQFIISTHSPIPLLGMPKETTILVVSRNKEDGVTVEKLDIDFTNLLPNTILSSPVFGFQDIIPDAHDNSGFVRVENTYSEIKDNDERRKDISEFLTDERKEEMLKLLNKK